MHEIYVFYIWHFLLVFCVHSYEHILKNHNNQVFERFLSKIKMALDHVWNMFIYPDLSLSSQLLLVLHEYFVKNVLYRYSNLHTTY